VVYAAETLQQTADTGLADLALSDGRLLLTEDKDFGEIIFRKKQRVPGIVLLRIPPEQSALMWPRLEAVVQRHGASLFGQYVVVTATGTRVRPLATPD
jgi:predicted nuclease of predicted toxin-antitoxin system